MIRFTWRQFRVQAAVAAGALVVIAAILAITGAHLVHLYDTTVATCKATNDCPAATSALLGTYPFLQVSLPALVIVVPGLIGIFWGAPLIAREIETGTFRLAWTQSISRARWLLVKLAVVGLSSMAAAGLLALMVNWWASPLLQVNQNRFSPAMFGVLGITPVGYAAFAFAVGVTAGLLIRRTLPAMASTLVAFVFARLAITYWVRPHLMAPLHSNVLINNNAGVGFEKTPTGISMIGQAPNIPNAWVYSTQIVDSAGHAPSAQFLERACPAIANPGAGPGSSGGPASVGPAPNQNAFQECVAKVSAKYHEVVAYQPASRFWPFQWYETAIFVALALILGGVCLWWIRHRAT